MPTTSASELVVLRGGFAVPRSAVDLLNDLERRGFDVHIDTTDGAVGERDVRRQQEGQRSDHPHVDTFVAADPAPSDA